MKSGPWSPEEVELMRLHYPTMPNRQLAAMLDRKTQKVSQQARRLLILKTPEAISANRKAAANRYPPELRSLISLRQKLIQAINQKARQ